MCGQGVRAILRRVGHGVPFTLTWVIVLGEEAGFCQVGITENVSHIPNGHAGNAGGSEEVAPLRGGSRWGKFC